MEKLEFKKTIKAAPQKVWKTLWSDDTYPQWTAAFSPSSRAVGDWKTGSEIQFLDGDNNGMIALIEENLPNQFMSFKILGEVRKGVEDRESDEVKSWAGGHENYELKEVPEGTELRVTLESDLPPEMKEMFKGMWPNALNDLATLSENN